MDPCSCVSTALSTLSLAIVTPQVDQLHEQTMFEGLFLAKSMMLVILSMDTRPGF